MKRFFWGVAFFSFFLSFFGYVYAAKWEKVSSEFKRKPRSFLFGVYGALNNRGFSEDVYSKYISSSIKNSDEFPIGYGVGIFTLFSINKYVSSEWRGHKFFYVYFDGEYLVERNCYTYIYTKKVKEVPLVSLNQMFFVRSYIPILKVFYGFGLNEVIGESDFPNWGFASTFGVEFLFAYVGIYFSYNPSEEYSWFELRAGLIF